VKLAGFSYATQNGSRVQLDVYFRPAAGGVASRIQCTIASFSSCSTINPDGSVGAALAAGFDFTGYTLIPGVLHAYKASTQDLEGLVRPRSQDY
jgi:hypothetical protein